MYHLHGHDVDACVLDMVKRCAPLQNIKKMLESLREYNLLSLEKYTELVHLVAAHASGIIDVDPIFAPSVQRLILSHSELETMQTNRAHMKKELAKLERRMQCYWDAKASAYVSWQTLEPPRKVPSQYLA